MAIKRAGIPAVDASMDPKVFKVLMAMKENLEIASGMRGEDNWKRRSVTLGMLIDLGVITEQWVQIRDRNESLDLTCMILCALEMYRGTLDTMEPLVVSSGKEQSAPAKFGAKQMAGTGDLAGSGLGIGGVSGFGMSQHPDQPRRSGFGLILAPHLVGVD